MLITSVGYILTERFEYEEKGDDESSWDGVFLHGQTERFQRMI